MFTHILVPVDLSENNGPALSVAFQMAKQNDGAMILLHVIEPIGLLESRETRRFYARLKKAAKQKLGRLAGRFETDVNVKSRIVLGNRAQEIVRYAMDHRIDVIIMKSHKIDITKPNRGWGTISYKVAILSQCPVLLVK